MIRRPPRSTQSRSSAASDVYKREHLRILLTSASLHQAAEAMQVLSAVVAVADMAETDRLLATLEAWWPAIEVLIITGVTNARTEAANTTIKNIKRTGRGFRNEHNNRRVSRLPRSQLRVNTSPVDPFTSK